MSKKKTRKNIVKGDQHERKKCIEVIDNVDVVRRSTVRTQVVTTEANGDEILIFGCLEIDPHPCQSGCMIVYRSCNASQIISKLKVKLSRIEVTECAKAEAKTFIIENRFDFAPS